MVQAVKPSTCEDVKTKKQHTEENQIEDIIPEIKQEKQEIEGEKAKPLSLQLVKVPESVAKVNVLNERGDLVYSMDVM